MLRFGTILSRLFSRHHSRTGLPAPVRALAPWLASGAAHLAAFAGILLAGFVLIEVEWEHEVSHGKPIMLSMLAAAPATTEVQVTLETPIEAEPLPEPRPEEQMPEATPSEYPLERDSAAQPVFEFAQHKSPHAAPEPKLASSAAPTTIAPPLPLETPPPTAVPRQQPAVERVFEQAELTVEMQAAPNSDAGIEYDDPPRKLSSNQPPAYPLEALAAGVEGLVMIRALISSTGAVGELKVERSSGSAQLDRAALDAVRGWRFTPARRLGGAVSAVVIVPVRFTIRR